jgi:hypothetical protein
MAASELLDENVIELKLTDHSHRDVSAALVRRALDFHIAHNDEGRLAWLLTHPSLTEESLTELLQSNQSMLQELGHRSGPRDLLVFLAEKYRYPEAVLTIAKHLYARPDVSPEEFQAFLAKHEDNEWMLKSLAHSTASTERKEADLLAVLQNHSAAYDYFIGVKRVLQRQERALEATSEETMRELFDTRDPAALRGLAQNPRTPESLLQELARTEKIKGAQEIRRLATHALRRFSKKS